MSNKSVQWCGLLVLFSVLIPLFQAKALTIAPDRIEEELAPGESFTKKIRIFNEYSETVLVSPELGVLAAPVNNGTVDVIESRAQSLNPDFLSFNPDTFQLPRGAWVDFPVEIHIPQIAKPGGYYGTLLFQFRGEDSSGGVGIVGKVGPLVLLSVIGSVHTNIEFLGMALEEHGGKLFDHLPAAVSFKLKNTGDVHVVPSGTLTITNWFGRVRERVEVNTDNLVLLPGWERTFIETLVEPGESGLVGEWQRFGLGPYRVELALALGDTTANYTLWFWVIPWKLLGLAALVLAILLTLRSLVARRERRVR